MKSCLISSPMFVHMYMSWYKSVKMAFDYQNEVIAVNGKAIISIEDLLDWVIMEDVRWIDGYPTVCPADSAPTDQEEKSQENDAMSVYTFTGDEGGVDEGRRTEGGRITRRQDGKASDKCNTIGKLSILPLMVNSGNYF